MKIDEAIEELERSTHQNRSTNNQRLREAIKIGYQDRYWSLALRQ